MEMNSRVSAANGPEESSLADREIQLAMIHNLVLDSEDEEEFNPGRKSEDQGLQRQLSRHSNLHIQTNSIKRLYEQEQDRDLCFDLEEPLTAA